MTEIAWAAARTKGTYCASFYRRLAAHRGKKRALVALANSHIQAVWHVLSTQSSYRELGADYFDRIRKTDLTQSLVRRLEKLGHKVTIQEAA